MENIIITGATGKIGRALISRIVARKSERTELFALVRQKPSLPLPPTVHLIYGSLPSALPNPYAIPKHSTFIHLAGITHSCVPGEYARINTEGTRSLVELAKTQSAKHFLFVSSRAIHPSGGPYSLSKREAEQIVTSSGLPYTILRFGEVHGTDGKEGLDQLLNLVRKGRLVFLPGDGEARVAPLSLQKAIGSLEKLLKAKPRNETITVAAPREITLNRIVEEAKRTSGKNPLVIHIPYWIMRLTAPFMCLLLHPPFYPDQIHRLLSPKEVGSGKSTLQTLL